MGVADRARCCGKSNYLYGVQGVASSNPATPTNRIKQIGQSSDWPFVFVSALPEKVPNKVPNRSQVWAGCASCPRTARHAACVETSKRPAGLPCRGLDRRRRADEARATAHCLRRASSLLHRRRCATAPASDKAARRLAPCRRLPCRGLHHASAHEAAPWLCLSRYCRSASADFLALLTSSHAARRLRRRR